MFARSLLTEEEHKPNAQETHLMSATSIGGNAAGYTHVLKKDVNISFYFTYFQIKSGRSIIFFLRDVHVLSPYLLRGTITHPTK